MKVCHRSKRRLVLEEPQLTNIAIAWILIGLGGLFATAMLLEVDNPLEATMPVLVAIGGILQLRLNTHPWRVVFNKDDNRVDIAIPDGFGRRYQRQEAVLDEILAIEVDSSLIQASNASRMGYNLSARMRNGTRVELFPYYNRETQRRQTAQLLTEFLGLQPAKREM